MYTYLGMIAVVLSAIVRVLVELGSLGAERVWKLCVRKFFQCG